MKTAKFKFKNGDEFVYDLENNSFIKKPVGNKQTIQQVIDDHNLEQDPKPLKIELTKTQIDDLIREKFKEQNNIIEKNV